MKITIDQKVFLDLCAAAQGAQSWMATQAPGSKWAVQVRSDLHNALAAAISERPTKNTDPKRLDKSNEGDAAVVTLDDGSTVSCIITDVNRDNARFEHKTGPQKHEYRFIWLRRSEWLDRVQLFPANSTFFVA